MEQLKLSITLLFLLVFNLGFNQDVNKVEFNLNKIFILGLEPNLKLNSTRFLFDISDSIGKTAYEAGLNLRIRFN